MIKKTFTNTRLEKLDARIATNYRVQRNITFLAFMMAAFFFIYALLVYFGFPDESELLEYSGKAEELTTHSGRHGSNHLEFRIGDQYFYYSGTRQTLVSTLVKKQPSLRILASDTHFLRDIAVVQALTADSKLIHSYEQSKAGNNFVVFLGLLVSLVLFLFAYISYKKMQRLSKQVDRTHLHA